MPPTVVTSVAKKSSPAGVVFTVAFAGPALARRDVITTRAGIRAGSALIQFWRDAVRARAATASAGGASLRVGAAHGRLVLALKAKPKAFVSVKTSLASGGRKLAVALRPAPIAVQPAPPPATPPSPSPSPSPSPLASPSPSPRRRQPAPAPAPTTTAAAAADRDRLSRSGGGRGPGGRKVRGGKRIAAVAATLVMLAVGAPAAGADTTWTKVSGDYNANIVVPSLGLTGTTAVVAWTQATGPLTQDIDTVSFTTSPTQDVVGPSASKAAQAWASLDYTHALFTPPGGGLALAFAGIHSTTTSDPLIGLATTLRNADGSWAAPFVVSSTSAGPSTAVLSGATPFIAGYATEGIDVFNGLVNHSPTPDQNLQPQLGGCCGYVPKMALDSAGHMWIAWYSNATGSTGEYVQQLDPATAAPIGPPVLAPNSESSNNNSFGTALACAATCRLVYGNSPAASNTDLIVSWWPGQGAPTTIADLAGTGQGAGRVLTAAYRADGRLWVAWFDGKTYRATLGDGTGAGGEPQDAGVPKGTRAAPMGWPASSSATTCSWPRTTPGRQPPSCRSPSS